MAEEGGRTPSSPPFASSGRCPERGRARPSHARGGTREGAGADHPALAGRVALVTGASAGIGRHLALALAAAGATVVGLARTPERIEAAMAQVATATGARTLALAADVADRAAVEAAMARMHAEGLAEVDLLVNNAGLMDTDEVPVWEADPDEWWAVVASHVRGAHLMLHAVVPGMVARDRGRVVSLASGLSVRGGPLYSAYSVGKTGLMRLTENLAAALEGTHVRAFDVSPGVVRTDMTARMSIHEGRTDWTAPEQVAELVVAIAAGELDQWSGRFVRAGADDLDVLRATHPEGVARQLRLRPYGEADPVG